MSGFEELSKMFGQVGLPANLAQLVELQQQMAPPLARVQIHEPTDDGKIALWEGRWHAWASGPPSAIIELIDGRFRSVPVEWVHRA